MDRLAAHNARQLYADVFWYGVLAGSALAFLSVYAARLGANSFQVGLLTAGPAVVNLLISLPAGRWLESRSHVRASFTTSIWHRLGFPALMVIAWLLPVQSQIWALPLLIMLMSIPGAILAIAFNAMFADIVAPEWRGQVVGQRNALLSVSMTVTTLFSGWLLKVVAFPLNYQLVFGLGTVGAALSSFYLGRIRPPETLPTRVGQPLLDNARPGNLRFADAPRPIPALRFLTRSRGRPLLRLDLLRSRGQAGSPFGAFLFAYFTFYAFQYFSIPLMPVFWVNDLRLSEWDISLGNSIFYGMMLLTSMALGRISQKLGHRRVLVAGAALYGLYPLFNGLAQDAWLFWIASFLGGPVWALLNGGLVNRLMERVPLEDLPSHMAFHNIALNLGILFGSFLGPALASPIGVREAILLAAGLRLLGGLLLARWG